MAKHECMRVKSLKLILEEIYHNLGDYEVWLSKDDEGNAFSKMLKDTSFSIEIDGNNKRIILFPSGIYYDEEF